MMMGFIDKVRAQGFAVESICRVLREQGCQVAARTYRAWKAAGSLPARSPTRGSSTWSAGWSGRSSCGPAGCWWLPKGCMGRRKMTALVRRRQLPDASAGAVDRAMRLLGLSGCRRSARGPKSWRYGT